MAIDVTALADYSFADIKKAAKAAMMSAALGGDTLTINGRTIGRISPKEARDLYDWAQGMENDESTDTSGGTALVQWGERY